MQYIFKGREYSHIQGQMDCLKKNTLLSKSQQISEKVKSQRLRSLIRVLNQKCLEKSEYSEVKDYTYKQPKVKEVNIRGTKIYFSLNKMKIQHIKIGEIWLNLAECRGKLIALNTYVRKEEKFKFNDLCFNPKKLEKYELLKLKVIKSKEENKR